MLVGREPWTAQTISDKRCSALHVYSAQTLTEQCKLSARWILSPAIRVGGTAGVVAKAREKLVGVAAVIQEEHQCLQVCTVVMSTKEPTCW